MTASLEQFFAKVNFVNDVDRFAVFTQVTRLLAAEDIIVRWNVPGMSSPARMSPSTRVLDIAPIAKDRENMIPGLVLHEVGHFLFSDNHSLPATTGHRIDSAAVQAKRHQLKNHRIWNIIEDGYVERRLVTKWPGALKHLRVLFDFDLELVGRDILAAAEHDLKSLQEAGSCPVQSIISALHLNVLGVKFGLRYPYPKGISSKLLALLERARTITESETARVALSSQLTVELAALAQAQTPRNWNFTVNDNGAMGNKLSAMGNKLSASGKAIESHVHEQVAELSYVDTVLGADLLAESIKTVDDFPEEQELAPMVGAGDELTGSRSTELPTAPEDGEEIADIEDAIVSLEQFISESKAAVLGKNAEYLKQISSTTKSESESTAPPLLVPTIDQVIETSTRTSIISPEIEPFTKTISLRAFHNAISKESVGKSLVNTFNKSLLKSRAVAQTMFQQFSTKANALNFAKITRRLTGALDPTRAALHRIYDDVFARRQLAPQKINHGYVLMVDWSASMADSALILFHRVSELVQFANLADVELDIWLYTTQDADNNNSATGSRSSLVPGTLITPARFIHVLNTKQHTGDALKFRLYALFCNAAISKKHPGARAHAAPAAALFNGQSFISGVFHYMSSTTIYEALCFGISQAEKLSAHRRAVLLMTDGADCSFYTIFKGPAAASNALQNVYPPINLRRGGRQVLLGGVNLIDIAERAYQADRYTSLVNLRTLASTLIAQEAARRGIAVIGVTWGGMTAASLATITSGALIAVNTSSREIKSKNLSEYGDIKNAFISHITTALLANIGQPAERV